MDWMAKTGNGMLLSRTIKKNHCPGQVGCWIGRNDNNNNKQHLTEGFALLPDGTQQVRCGLSLRQGCCTMPDMHARAS